MEELNKSLLDEVEFFKKALEETSTENEILRKQTEELHKQNQELLAEQKVFKQQFADSQIEFQQQISELKAAQEKVPEQPQSNIADKNEIVCNISRKTILIDLFIGSTCQQIKVTTKYNNQ